MRVSRRLVFLAAIIAVPSAIVINDGIIPLWLNAFGVIGIAFGFGAFFLNWHRATRFFTRDVVGQAQLHALSLQGFAASVILSAAQAIHWRTIGHSTAFIDSSASIVIRVITDLSIIGVFLTAGQFDDTVSWNRLGKVGLIVATVLMAMLLIGAHDHRGLFTQEPEQTIVTPEGARP